MFTNKEFKNLERYENGDIVNLGEVFFKIKPAQTEKLSSDDWSRMDGLEEEMRCMVADLEVEFA
jgi:hypothetical protein